MGSYLSIVNDTKDTWQCKIGPDEAALKISGLVIGMIGALATVIGTGGAGVPLLASVASSGVVSVVGVSATALGTVTGFGQTIAEKLSDKLAQDGFDKIDAGGRKKYGKMSLSLWQQGTCTRTVVVNAKTVRVETLYMRPIFSGATDKSNNDHSIQWWINKWGTEKQEIVGEAGRRLEAEEAEESEAIAAGPYVAGAVGHVNEETGEKLFHFSPNGNSTANN